MTRKTTNDNYNIGDFFMKDWTLAGIAKSMKIKGRESQENN